MESQPQNPEFRINPENIYPCKCILDIQVSLGKYHILLFSHPWSLYISRRETEHLLLYGEINGTQYIIVHSFRSSGDDGSSECSISGDPVSGDPVSGDPVLSDGDVPSYQLEYAPWLFTSLALMIFCVNIHWNGM